MLTNKDRKINTERTF